MKPSRATQPYRKGVARQPGLADKAMKRGRTATGFNPSDIMRGMQKGANGARKVLQPVAQAAPAKGSAAPMPAGGGLATKMNRTSNARAGGIYREVKGTSKSGVPGTFHVYAGGRRVFVADPGAKPRTAAARSFAKRARG